MVAEALEIVRWMREDVTPHAYCDCCQEVERRRRSGACRRALKMRGGGWEG